MDKLPNAILKHIQEFIGGYNPLCDLFSELDVDVYMIDYDECTISNPDRVFGITVPHDAAFGTVLALALE